MKRKVVLFFLLCKALLLGAQSVDTQDSVLSMAYKWYPQYVTFLASNQLDSVLAYAYTDLVPVVYNVNQTDLRQNPQLDSIVSLINRIKSDKRVKVAYIWIGGSASPEGSRIGNRRLGQVRANMLADFLKKTTGIKNSELRVENLWEDWFSVTRMLMDSDFPRKDEVLHIIATEPDWDQRKRKIKMLDGGRTWQRLVKEVFPPFRNARMVIVCSAEEVKKRALFKVAAKYNFPHPTLSLPTFDASIPVQPSLEENRFWAIKTNGLFLGALIANAGFEVELWRKWSLDVPFWYSPYDYKPTRKIRLLATQPELRYWLKKAGQGSFFGLHSHIVGFNVAINDNGRYQDPNHALWGVGLSYGYATHLDKAKRWSLEFNIGAGFAEYDYDAYRNWHNGPKFQSGTDFYWGLTRAGISIAYKFYTPRKK